jgi:hypothetical protein
MHNRLFHTKPCEKKIIKSSKPKQNQKKEEEKIVLSKQISQPDQQHSRNYRMSAEAMGMTMGAASTVTATSAGSSRDSPRGTLGAS